MKTNKKITWINIVYGILIFAVGILAFVFAIVSPEKVSAVVSYSIAVCLFLLGITFIFYSLVTQTKDLLSITLVIGSICIALGAVLCIDTAFVTSFFIYFLSILLIALGAVALVKMFIFIRYKEKVSVIIGLAVLSIIFIVLGSLGIAYMNVSFQWIFGGLGLVLVGLGIAELVIGIKLLKNKDNPKNAQFEEIEQKKVIENK